MFYPRARKKRTRNSRPRAKRRTRTSTSSLTSASHRKRLLRRALKAAWSCAVLLHSQREMRSLNEGASCGGQGNRASARLRGRWHARARQSNRLRTSDRVVANAQRGCARAGGCGREGNSNRAVPPAARLVSQVFVCWKSPELHWTPTRGPAHAAKRK